MLATYEKLYHELRDATSWAESLGARVESTRAATYLKLLNELAGPDLNEVLEGYDRRGENKRLYNALHESALIVTVHRHLGQQDGPRFRERLKKFFRGPESVTGEQAGPRSNEARNFGAELVVAANFAAAGYGVDLECDGDLALPTGRHDVYIECKRPQNEKRVEDRVKDGMGQLRRRLNAGRGPAARGMLALALDKTLNPSGWTLGSFPTPLHISQKMGGDLVSFDARHKAKWLRENRERGIYDRAHPRIVGALLMYNAVTVVNHEQVLVATELLVSTPSRNVPTPGKESEFFLLRQMEARLREWGGGYLTSGSPS